MSRYQHKKGQIRDNAIEALLHDPLFRQRVETSQKGKGSYRRKEKHARAGYQEASGKKYILPLAFSFISQRKPPQNGRFLNFIPGRCVVLKGHGFQSAASLLQKASEPLFRLLSFYATCSVI